MLNVTVVISNAQYFRTCFVFNKRGRVETLEYSSERNDEDSAVAYAVRTERQRLLNFIRKRVRREEDAEDILQDVFFQLSENYDIAEPIERISAWLYRVARNKIIDWYRKKRSKSFTDIGDPLVTESSGGVPLNLEEILFDPSQNRMRCTPGLLYGPRWRMRSTSCRKNNGKCSRCTSLKAGASKKLRNYRNAP